MSVSEVARADAALDSRSITCVCASLCVRARGGGRTCGCMGPSPACTRASSPARASVRLGGECERVNV